MIKTVKDSSLLNEYNRNDDVSWFTNISSCIWLSKVTNIIKNIIDNKNDSKRCIDILNEEVRVISLYRITDIERYRVILNDYTYKYLNDSIGSVEQFISDYSDNNISKYFKVKYIGSKRQWSQSGNRNPKNIIMDFNADYFAKHAGRLEDIPLYPTCYCHYFMIAFLLDIMTKVGIILPKYNKNESFYKHFFWLLFENLNSSVLTGLEAYAEYELDYHYCCFYDELRKLTSAFQNRLIFYATPHNKSFEVTIKEYSLITKMFTKYRGVRTDKDIGRIIPNPSSKSGKYKIKDSDVIHINSDFEHDKVNGVFSKLRITEGSNPKRMKVSVILSGQRAINRVFSSISDVNNNIKTHKIIEYIPSTTHMIAFLLWVVLNCSVESENNFKGFEHSTIPIWGQYISEYMKDKGNKQGRNTVINTAIPIMLSSKSEEEQESFINSHFSESQSQQKALIRAGIRKINEIKNSVPDKIASFTERLIKELKHVYNW